VGEVFECTMGYMNGKLFERKTKNSLDWGHIQKVGLFQSLHRNFCAYLGKNRDLSGTFANQKIRTGNVTVTEQYIQKLLSFVHSGPDCQCKST
jgi:hypothetical protein